jgi:hypothetical protein
MIKLPFLKNFEDLGPRRGDLQARLSQVIAFQCGDLSIDPVMVIDLTAALQLPILRT